MPRFTLVQLALLELAGAALLGGADLGGVWRYPGLGVAVVLVLLALVPLHRRWLYQVASSWVGLLRRRHRVSRSPGLAGLLGSYSIEAVNGGSNGGPIGVVRSGTTWCLPLVLALDGVFNDDSAVPVQVLTSLLQVEDVPLSSVRLFTMTTPARVAADAPSGSSAPLSPLAARYCLLTLDTRRAADAVAARGGSQDAVHQILRRCAVHAEQVFAASGLRVRRLGSTAVEGLFASWLGPASPRTGRRSDQTVEGWGDVRVGGTWSTSFAVTGSGPDLALRVARLAAVAPTPLVATSLLLRRGARARGVDAAMLVRLSAPESYPHADATKSLALLAKAYDLVMQRLGGEQGALLRATTPVGVGEPA
ncbi:type VII secretion protein EccE [Jatrophihabitans endophyticus]|uniref:type VII secretion protein EccE n=1 Tax=Jatrophihabitans endophyticus TaxID=1206085 RepID=UPI0019F91F1C|nr:type VII secretion protein EccE [Jatrophihabitans endophyticus]MBE7186697.1 hypothetical protein [Jatrophihabitans endophyticus]